MAKNFLKLNNGNFLKITAAVDNFVSAPEPDYLCFTAEQANSTVELCKSGSPSISNTAYSLDGNIWNTFTPVNYYSAGTNKITLTNIGDKVYFRNNITDNFSSANYLQFVMTGKIAASGNVNSVYSSINFSTLTILSYDYCYYHLFTNCASLTKAPSLPAITLADYCYYYMFSYCTSLTQAPSLPAITLATYCYADMFARCTNLISAPSLPAHTLANFCYYNMFRDCENLVSIPVLQATILARRCYQEMFASCIKIKLSTAQTEEYITQYRIPTSGTGTMATSALGNMFVDTGGTFTGTPEINTTYYTSNEII